MKKLWEEKVSRFTCRIRVALLLTLPLIFCAAIVSCSSSTDNFIVRDLKITPSEAVLGEYVLIEFWIDIKGDIGVSTDMTLVIDDNDIQTKMVHAEANSTTRVYFRVTAKETGKHKVNIRSVGINDLSAIFEVKDR